ncbi:exonuclease SbcC [Methanomicrobium sp. W14]|uniref:SbcC/MukB-like Walker B domain-containing protein n=1 Tax=Methanomicrobium sp. W14 TaxID=2817839 RepID=UPI001AE37E3A|nr:AAA family ATPase [Methanomicrobium sp. W14]MBP2134148.1 exonuclease SbcC [Methanomicrobium sp. W14]
MKILKLRFSNLNSLYGEWSVDFTLPEYTNDGIFAITGPTGAGKSTILDAVCLALYGQTPRLGKISQGSNEIMSRKTGECFSEVIFGSAKGRFRCHWSQKRSYSKPDGNLQIPKHEISDADSGKILETSRNTVLKRIEDLTGMNFERFTRSVMLAQGDFAVFLNADPADRSPILEQITGTEIYSRISVKVHEKTREEKEKLSVLNAQAGAVTLISDEEKKGLLKEKEEKRKRAEELSTTLNRLSGYLLWISGMDKTREEIAGLEEKRASVLKKEMNFSGNLKRLEKAKSALKADGSYRDYKSTKELYERNKSEYEGLAIEIENAGTELAEITKKHVSANEEHNLLKKRYSEEEEIIKAVNVLDAGTEREDISYREYSKKQDELSEKHKEYENSLENFKREYDIKKKRLSQILDYLEINAVDGLIFENLGVIKSRISSLYDYEKKASAIKESLKKTIIKKKECLKKLEKYKTALEEKKEERKTSKSKVNEISDEIKRVCGENDPESLIKEKSRLERELSVFEKTTAADNNIKELNIQKESLLKRNLEIETEKLTLLRAAGAVSEEITTLEEVMSALEKKLILAAKVQSLREERKNLFDGKPCPLCGSTKHPYSKNINTLPGLSGTESDITKHKSKIKSLREKLLSNNKKYAGLETESEGNNNAISEAEDKAKKTFLAKKEELEKIGIDPTEIKEDDFYKRAHSELSEKLDSLNKTISGADNLEKELKEADKRYVLARESVYDCEKDYDNSKNAFQSLEKEESSYSSQLNETEEKISENTEFLKDTLSEFFGKDSREKITENLSDVPKILEERKNIFLDKTSEKERLKRDTEILSKDIESAEKRLEETERETGANSSRLETSLNRLLKLKKERFDIYGDKDPENEKKRFQELLSSAEKTVFDLNIRKVNLEAGLKSKSGRKGELEREVNSLSEKLEEKSAGFYSKLCDSGFKDEEEFLDSLLSPAETEKLETEHNEISGMKSRTEAMLSERKKAYESEAKKALTDKEAPVIEAEKEKAENDRNWILSEIGAVDSVISENERKRKTLSEQLKNCERQKENYLRWERLHELIGSSDGKKFRNFAQCLTFGIVISQANLRLEEMNDRYILVQNPEKQLDLCVIDNYQAGEVRSTKNLSGGESFIISLALALGLSAMSGKNVRVDSLFLDEGFGTLDDEALDTALDTLSGLRQDGKLIGIISHVPAIKQRIPTKIEVIKKQGGKSVLKGPGCNRR